MKDTIKGFIMLTAYPTYRWIKTNLIFLIQCGILLFFFGLLITSCNKHAVEDNQKHHEEVQEKKGCIINPIYPMGVPMKEFCQTG